MLLQVRQDPLPIFEGIFTETTRTLADAGYVSLGAYFLDGIKIEADANKCTFIWTKSTERFMKALQERVLQPLRT